MGIYNLSDSTSQSMNKSAINSGEVWVLGYDLKLVNQRHLRSRISYLKHHTQLSYNYKVREIIDPDYKYSNENILELIEYFQLGDMVKEFVDAELKENKQRRNEQGELESTEHKTSKNESQNIVSC